MHSDDSKYDVQELFDEAIKVSIKPNGNLSSFIKMKTIVPTLQASFEEAVMCKRD